MYVQVSVSVSINKEVPLYVYVCTCTMYVFVLNKRVHVFLSQVTKEREKANILWLYDHFKDFKCVTVYNTITYTYMYDVVFETCKCMYNY